MAKVSKEVEALIELPAFHAWADMHKNSTKRLFGGVDGADAILALATFEFYFILTMMVISVLFIFMLPQTLLTFVIGIFVGMQAGKSVRILMLCHAVSSMARAIVKKRKAA